MPIQYETIYTTGGAARRLDLSEGTIRKLADSGVLPVTRTKAGARLFCERDLDEYASHRQRRVRSEGNAAAAITTSPKKRKRRV